MNNQGIVEAAATLGQYLLGAAVILGAAIVLATLIFKAKTR